MDGEVFKVKEDKKVGKPYVSELKNLKSTYEWALKHPIKELTRFLNDSSRLPLYTIGSGGSLTSAAFASIMHESEALFVILSNKMQLRLLTVEEQAKSHVGVIVRWETLGEPKFTRLKARGSEG